EVLDHLTVGDHHFLVLEYLDGKPLNTFFARRHPLIEADPDERRLAEYTDWALDVHARVERAVADVHARGVVFNDLHLFNIMIRDDDSVALLDFEAAHHVDEPGRQTVANPAFVAPADRRGVAVDRYALACLRLALFLPLTSLFALDRYKAAHLADLVAKQFPVDRAFLDAAVEEITRQAADASPARGAGGPVVPVEPGDWPRSRESMASAIHASATPSRTDRLFPGDIAQFATAGGGLAFGHGAAGVLYALSVSGADRREEHEQ
ncbi:lantipeptide synthetase, partial [Streptomyces sp. TRM76130]|nr:lantipeptide synthetase [Streptomyces sp. TRM76130]